MSFVVLVSLRRAGRTETLTRASNTSDNYPALRLLGQSTRKARAFTNPEENALDMRHLNFELKQLCQRNRDGSFATQAARERVLDLAARQLQEAGFRQMSASSLKPKHVNTLVSRWKAEEQSVGTIKNRMAALRWWAEKIAKPNVIARDNDAYGLAHRQYVTNVSKAHSLDERQLLQVSDAYTAMSLRLQERPSACVARNP